MTQNELKQAVAIAAVDYITPKLTKNAIVGVGTGSTANCFIDALAHNKHLFKGAVASSEATAKRLKDRDIKVFDLNDVRELLVYVDGADEADANLCLIKGGGAALTREKIVAACAEEFVCIADESKWVDVLGHFPLPIEVIPMARAYVMRELSKLGGRGIHREHVITDNGNDIIDVYDLHIDQPAYLEVMLNAIVGVVTSGLFASRPANVLLLGRATGVEIIVSDV